MRRGRRLSIIGLLQPLISFVYGLVIGGVNRKSYIQIMEIEAQEAEKFGRIRVIVQDNGPIHDAGKFNSYGQSGKSGFIHLFSA
jgi:putative transposase